jgi:hypothetical protein
MLESGRIEAARPFPPEVSGNDHIDLPRIALHFDQRSFGPLRRLIDELNRLPSAPAPGHKPPTVRDDIEADRARERD